jgi:hypothetical protein
MKLRLRPSLPVAVLMLVLAHLLVVGLVFISINQSEPRKEVSDDGPLDRDSMLADWWSRPLGEFSPDKYLDRDLTTLTDPERFVLAVWLDKQLNTEERAGPRKNPPGEPNRRPQGDPQPLRLGGPSPWFFWLMKTGDGIHGLVLLEQAPFVDIPGGTSLTIRVFDLQGTHRTSTEFWMGPRTMPSEACKRFDLDLNADVIEIESDSNFPRGGMERICVGIVEDRPVLLRVEDDAGRYCSPHGRHDNRAGPPVPERTVEEWQRVLQSDNPLLVLEAVLWLDGRDVWEPGPNEGQRKTVKQHPATQRILSQLAESPHPWIKETALQVLKPAP